MTGMLADLPGVCATACGDCGTVWSGGRNVDGVGRKPVVSQFEFLRWAESGPTAPVSRRLAAALSCVRKVRSALWPAIQSPRT